jgi:O-antigen ligase
MMWLLAAVALVGLFERIRSPIAGGAVKEAIRGIVSTLGNSSILGSMLVLLLPAAYGVLVWAAFAPKERFAGRGIFRRSLFFESILAILAGNTALFLSRSRAAILSAGVSLIVFSLIVARCKSGFFPSKKARTVFQVLAFAALCVVIIFSVSIIERKTDYLDVQGPRYSDDEPAGSGLLYNRLLPWKTAVKIWLSDPPLSPWFGRGPGSYYSNVFLEFPSDFRLQFDKRSFKHAHNELLNNLAEGGTVLLLAFLIYMGSAAWTSFKVLRDGTRRLENRIIAGVILSVFGGVFIHSQFSLAYRSIGSQLLLHVWVAISYINYHYENDKPCSGAFCVRNITRRFSKLIIILICIGFLIFPALAIPSIFRSEWFLRQAVEMRDSKSIEIQKSRIAKLDSSLMENPQNIYALYEKVVTLRLVDPILTIQTANQIEEIIPGYRDTALIKGIALAELERYSESESALRRQISYDSIAPEPYFHLLAVELLKGDVPSAVEVMRELLYWRHVFYQQGTETHPDIQEMDLVFSAGRSSTETTVHADETITAAVSLGYLTELLTALSLNTQMGYESLLVNLFINTGRIFDQLDYSDIELEYYMMAAVAGALSNADRDYIFTKADFFYTHVSEYMRQNTLSTAEERKWLERLHKYTYYMIRLKNSDDLQKQYRRLTEELNS